MNLTDLIQREPTPSDLYALDIINHGPARAIEMWQHRSPGGSTWFDCTVKNVPFAFGSSEYRRKPTTVNVSNDFPVACENGRWFVNASGVSNGENMSTITKAASLRFDDFKAAEFVFQNFFKVLTV